MERHLPAQPARLQLGEAGAVELDAAFRGVEEAREEELKRRLAAARGADQRGGLATTPVSGGGGE